MGLPGQGKTLLMARWAEQDMRRGHRVAANFRLVGADFLPDFASIIQWCSRNPNGVLYIDEAGVVLSSRNWRAIPLEIQILFAQHRHFGLDLIWAAQRVGQVDKSLRELSQYISRIKKVFPGLPNSGLSGGGYALVPMFLVETFETDRLERPAWSERFLYRSRWAEMYRVSEILTVDSSEQYELDAAMRQWHGSRPATEGLRIR